MTVKRYYDCPLYGADPCLSPASAICMDCPQLVGGTGTSPPPPRSPAPVPTVDHPAHYGGAEDPHETIAVVEGLGWGEGFCRGNALKYLMRAGRKGTETDEAADLRKALWYIDRDLCRLQRDDEG